MKRPQGWIIGCLSVPVLLLGIGLLVGAFISGASVVRLSNEGVLTTGRVVELVAEDDGDSITYQPVIEFEADGERYRFTSRIASSNPPAIGHDIDVLYDPLNPFDAIEGSLWARWLLPGLLGFFGLMATAFGLLMVIGGRWLLKRGPMGQRNDDLVISQSTMVDTQLTAEYRKVEPSQPDAEGRFLYRVVAKGEDGNVYYSRWLEDDPTMEFLMAGTKTVPLATQDGVLVVDVDAMG